MIVENLMKSIERGKQGLNIGLSTGLPVFDSLTFGVQRKWLTIWSGDSGISTMPPFVVIQGEKFLDIVGG